MNDKTEIKSIKRLLNIAVGQINGVSKMLESDEYCVNISSQIMAAIGVLKKANKKILDGHIKGCVVDAFNTKSKSNQDDAIKELSLLIDKLQKL